MSQQRGLRWMGPAGLIVSVFVAGALTGAAGVRWLDRRPPEDVVRIERPDGRGGPRREDWFRGRGSSNRFMEELDERLNLSEDQRTRIDSIVQAQRRRSREVMEGIRPELTAALDSMNAGIEAVLDSDQRTEFRSMLEEARARLERPGRPGPRGEPGGPPPPMREPPSGP